MLYKMHLRNLNGSSHKDPLSQECGLFPSGHVTTSKHSSLLARSESGGLHFRLSQTIQATVYVCSLLEVISHRSRGGKQ